MTPLFMFYCCFVFRVICFMQRALRAFSSDLDRLLLEPKAASRWCYGAGRLKLDRLLIRQRKQKKKVTKTETKKTGRGKKSIARRICIVNTTLPLFLEIQFTFYLTKLACRTDYAHYAPWCNILNKLGPCHVILIYIKKRITYLTKFLLNKNSYM